MALSEIKNLYVDKDRSKVLLPRTNVKAVSDDNGVGLDALLRQKASEEFVIDKINQAQLGEGDNAVDLSVYATKDEVANSINNIDFPVDSVNGKTGAVSLGAADVGAAPVEFINHAFATNGDVTDLMQVDLTNQYGHWNKPLRIYTSDVTTLANRPTGFPTSGPYIGIRYTDWYEPNRIAVTIHEVYPALGRIWVNHYNVSAWEGWKCIDTADKFASASHNHSASNITSGTLPIARGGTGATDAATARSNLGITLANIGAAASSHKHSTSNITSGTLGVARGGTGRATLTSNAIIAGNTTSAVKQIATASGALYATAANGAAKFGTLPIAQGGTGATTAANARLKLDITPANIGAVNKNGDTVNGWLKFKDGDTLGAEWKTNDGTRFALRPYAAGNLFQITTTPSGSGDEQASFNIDNDGKVWLGKALPVSSGGTGATTAAAAISNLGINDYIVAQGTSSIWTYRKWNSGIAEVWTNNATATVNTSKSWGSVYYGLVAQSQPYPFSFTATPVVTASPNAYSSGGDFWLCSAANSPGDAKKSPAFYAITPTSSSVKTGVNIYACGRWK